MKTLERRNQFTLIELMIVIAVIAIIASMMFPALNKSREMARGITCLNNKKQLMLGQAQYAGDYSNFYVGYLQCSTSVTKGMWCVVLSNSQDAKGDFTVEGGGYVNRTSLQCPSVRNLSKPGDINFDYWHSCYGIDWSFPNGSVKDYSRNEVLGDYILSVATPEHYVFALLKMRSPSATLIFADTYWQKNNCSIPRFLYNTLLDSAAVVQAHAGKSAVSFADGHVALHSGLELKNMPYTLQKWYQNTDGLIGF